MSPNMNSSPSNSLPFPITAPRRFSNLPQELRDLVWEHAVRSIGPRIIALQETVWWNKSERIPALLHACRDSRAVALKRYKLITAKMELVELARDGRHFYRMLNCFVDYEKDIFMTGYHDVSPDNICQDTIVRLLEPARRLLTITSHFGRYCPHRNRSCEYTHFAYGMQPYTKSGSSKEMFALQVGYPRDDELFEFVFQDDLTETMDRNGTGWMRKCQAVDIGDWHEKDVKCCDSCKQEFKDQSPAIQVLDFEKYLRSQASIADETARALPALFDRGRGGSC